MCKDNKCTCCKDSEFVIQKANKGNSGITKSTGDSRAIRIGNDIKLDVTIQELNGMDIINIKAIKCIIVNTTPMLSDHCGTAYEVHCCGLPTYHIHPMHQYWGYGMHPFGPKNWHHGLCPHYDYFCRNPYGRFYLKPIHTDHKPFEFIAPVKALPDRNKVRVFFPASAQMLCGLYSLTFVIDLYEPGYHCNNLRTITVDYNNVFELVPNMEGAAGDITIDIDKQLGVNVFDNLMFGQNTTVTDIQENKKLSSLEIVGGDNVKVGDTIWFYAREQGTQQPLSEGIDWTVYGDSAALVAESNGRIMLKGIKVENVIDGESTVDVEVKSTDGSNLSVVKTLTVHNYATDINLENLGSPINIGNEMQIATSIYVTQEDGTRLCTCECGNECQAISVGEVSIESGEEYIDVFAGIVEDGEDCSWTYDEMHGNLYSTKVTDMNQRTSTCCPESVFTIRNTNNTSETKTATILLTSRVKGQNGSPVQKEITIKCDGKPFNVNEDHSNDRYVNGGSYNNGTLTLNLNASDDVVTIDGLPVNEEPDYWYNGN